MFVSVTDVSKSYNTGTVTQVLKGADLTLDRGQVGVILGPSGLRHEQERLMQAHYADAIPLSLLKREQDRILAELDSTHRRIDAHHGEYADARAHLDDANRRLCNQAFFTKVYIEEDDNLRVENNPRTGSMTR